MGLESFQSQAALRATAGEGNTSTSLALNCACEERIYIEFSGKNTFIFILKLKCN